MKKTLVKSYLRYLLPTIATMILYSTYTMVDGIFVGQGVGATGITAVNISMPYVNFIFAISILISIGSLNLVTYQLGKGNKKKADEIFSIAFAISLIGSLAIAIPSLIFIDELVIFLGASSEVKALVIDYLSVILIFAPFYVVAYLFEIMVKADGRPFLATAFMALSALSNIVLDYIFIFKFGMGVRGAAIATGIAQLLPALAYLAYFISPLARLKFRKFNFKAYIVKEIISYGLPGALNELSPGFITLLFNNVIGRLYGIRGLDAYTIISYVMSFVVNIIIGINQASQPLISFNFGKGDYKNALRLRKYMVRSAFILSALMFVVIYLRPKLFIDLFIGDYDGEFLTFTSKNLRTFSIAFLIMAYNIVNASFMSAVKNTTYDFYITILRGYVIIGLLIFSLPWIFSKEIVWHILTISELLTLFVTIFLVRKEEGEIKKFLARDMRLKYKKDSKNNPLNP